MKLLRQNGGLLAALVAGTLLAWLIQWATGMGPLWTAFLAALAATAAAAFAARSNLDDGPRRFAVTVGREIDAIMIGAAETSYFVDSVKKKIEQDVQTASDIVNSSDQNARTTELIANNAESASRVAHRVVSHS